LVLGCSLSHLQRGAGGFGRGESGSSSNSSGCGISTISKYEGLESDVPSVLSPKKAVHIDSKQVQQQSIDAQITNVPKIVEALAWS
jgi:hypothetical protein